MQQAIRDMLYSILDGYRNPTPDEAVAICAEFSPHCPPRLTHTAPTLPALNVTIPQAGVCGLMLDPSAPRDSDAPGCNIPTEPFPLQAEASLPPIDGTEAVSARGRSYDPPRYPRDVSAPGPDQQCGTARSAFCQPHTVKGQ